MQMQMKKKKKALDALICMAMDHFLDEMNIPRSEIHAVKNISSRVKLGLHVSSLVKLRFKTNRRRFNL
jgi:hypothetical protein